MTLEQEIKLNILNSLEKAKNILENKPTHSYTSNFARNLIVFGAPGTGKSWKINKRKERLLNNFPNNYERVTFYPDYSYANFVGSYKPIPTKDKEGNDIITYEYVPGPFIRTLVKAIKNPTEPHLLIIEEINRAEVAAVFGDVFQLLDRAENNVSEYPIQTSEELKKYLAKPDVLGGNPNLYNQIQIPDNMFIWATMNSADQGVFPMDTAFKRRWTFEYLGINNNENEIKDKFVILGNENNSHKIEWNDLRHAINEELSNLGINEDKLLGPYFLSKNILQGDILDSELFKSAFKNKILMYLFDDAAKQRRASIFNTDKVIYNRYSSICEGFEEFGVEVFCKNITDKITIIKD